MPKQKFFLPRQSDSEKSVTLLAQVTRLVNRHLPHFTSLLRSNLPFPQGFAVTSQLRRSLTATSSVRQSPPDQPTLIVTSRSSSLRQQSNSATSHHGVLLVTAVVGIPSNSIRDQPHQNKNIWHLAVSCLPHPLFSRRSQHP